MATMTLAVPDDLKRKMDKYAEINWSEIARQAFKKRIEDFEFVKRFISDSELTEEDALRLGKLAKKGMAKRLKKEIFSRNKIR